MYCSTRHSGYLPIADCRLPSTDCRWPIIECQLSCVRAGVRARVRACVRLACLPPAGWVRLKLIAIFPPQCVFCCHVHAFFHSFVRSSIHL